ncbi:MAG: Mutator mutT protein [Parcubacteria group bacterium GW2011_GWD2_38_11]|nr:MAG: Mutator mutT protein [Parcubacteria group bacterium GW2011_GWD2_38_11]
MDNDRNMELLSCFDETGNHIEPHTRKEVHEQPLKFWHAVTNIWVINSKSEILCTHRSSINEGNPNKWQTYVGGHVKHEDSFKETAVRELDEELGLTPDDGKLISIKEEKGEHWKHITAMFAFFWDGKAEDTNAKDGEIDGAKWMSFEDYMNDFNTNPEQWCNNINHELYTDILKLKVE